jgi:hypothetical protein
MEVSICLSIVLHAVGLSKREGFSHFDKNKKQASVFTAN